MAYNGFLKDGTEIYVPNWPVDAALMNLSSGGKYIGADNLLRIADLNIPAAILAITESDSPAETKDFIKHCVCHARIDGQKITPNNVNSLFEENLAKMIEIFTVVIHAQYSDFFVSGLVKANSQES